MVLDKNGLRAVNHLCAPIERAGKASTGEGTMRRSQAVGLVAVFAVAAALSSAGAQSGAALQSVEVKYAPNPFGEGALLSGPLDKPVLYTQRVHLKAGGLVPPHTHPDTRYTT